MNTNHTDHSDQTPAPDPSATNRSLRAKLVLDENGNVRGISYLDAVDQFVEFVDQAITDPAELARITRPPQP